MIISKNVILQYLNNEDIEGLLALGAPVDEYDPEAKIIAETLAEMQNGQFNLDNIISIIAAVWSKYFGPFSETDIEKRLNGFQKVALHILRLDA